MNGKNEKDRCGVVGSQIHYLPTCLSVCLSIFVHFLWVSLEMEEPRGLCVALPFSLTLWRALREIQSRTLTNQCDECPTAASTCRSHSYPMRPCTGPRHTRILHVLDVRQANLALFFLPEQQSDIILSALLSTHLSAVFYWAF